MPVIKCKLLNDERPYIYDMQFIDRHKRRSHITCIEGYSFTVVYHNGVLAEKTGVIQRVMVDEEHFCQSYIILDINDDAMFGALKIYFNQIVCIKNSQINDAYYIAVMHGFRGTLADWFKKMRGSRGYSAYEIAVQNGFVGDEKAWLDSIISNTKLEELEARVDSINENSQNEIASITSDLDEIKNSLKSKMITYEEGMDLPTDGSIYAISINPDQLESVPINPGCFIIIPETSEMYIDAVDGSRIKLATASVVDAKIEEIMAIKEL